MIGILAIAMALGAPPASSAPAAGKAKCGPATAAYRAQAASAADSWQRRRGIWVDPAFLEVTARQACDTASSIAAEGTVGADRIGPAVSAGVDDYLTRYADLSRPARTVGASMLSSLGVQGFSRPVPRALGLVQFIYVKSPDRLVVGTRALGRVQALMMPPGPFSYAGYAGQQRVCAGDSKVVASTTVEVRC